MTNAEKKIFAANECNTSELNDHESRVFAEFRSNELPQDPEVDPPSNSSAL